MGGIRFRTRWSDLCESFSLKQNKWRVLPRIKVEMDRAALSSVSSGQAYVFGGWSPNYGHLSEI